MKRSDAKNFVVAAFAFGTINLACVCLAAMTGVLLTAPAKAQQAGIAPVTAPVTAPAIEGWDGLVESLRTLGPKALTRLTPAQRQDPQYRQEIGRLLLAALAARTLEAISADPGHPQFLPSLNPTLNVFQPNADTIYKTAKVDDAGIYRIRGVRGSARIVKLGQFGASTASTGTNSGAARGYLDINALPVDRTGRYDLIVGATRPAGYVGPWWKLEQGVTSLMLRQVLSDWHKEQDPSITIERLDIPVSRPRPSAAELQGRLEALGPQTGNTALFFIDHAEKLRAEGYENKLKEFDVNSSLSGLTGQFYYEGAYRLKPDEALILEAKVPEKCGYYSTILTNDIFETTDWVNNHSSLNDSQAKVGKDGVLRIVVSAKDPGFANWLDTAGYPVGVVQGRWTDCSSQPIPTLKLVKVADIARYMPVEAPRVSIAQREQMTRDRRADFLLRRQW